MAGNSDALLTKITYVCVLHVRGISPSLWSSWCRVALLHPSPPPLLSSPLPDAPVQCSLRWSLVSPSSPLQWSSRTPCEHWRAVRGWHAGLVACCLWPCGHPPPRWRGRHCKGSVAQVGTGSTVRWAVTAGRMGRSAAAYMGSASGCGVLAVRIDDAHGRLTGAGGALKQCTQAMLTCSAHGRVPTTAVGPQTSACLLIES